MTILRGPRLMKYRIKGVDKHGKEKVLRLEVDSVDDALEKLQKHGIVAKSIDPIAPTSREHPKSAAEYEYRMIQAGTTFLQGPTHPNAAATWLQSLVHREGLEGWDFYRVDTMFVEEAAGCLTTFWATSITKQVNVVTFRRTRE